MAVVYQNGVLTKLRERKLVLVLGGRALKFYRQWTVDITATTYAEDCRREAAEYGLIAGRT